MISAVFSLIPAYYFYKISNFKGKHLSPSKGKGAGQGKGIGDRLKRELSGYWFFSEACGCVGKFRIVLNRVASRRRVSQF